MTTVINIHKDSFMFMTGVMSCLWQCHLSLMHTPSNKVLPKVAAPSLLLHLSSLYSADNISRTLPCKTSSLIW